MSHFDTSCLCVRQASPSAAATFLPECHGMSTDMLQYASAAEAMSTRKRQREELDGALVVV
jgi:hypothetical protein